MSNENAPAIPVGFHEVLQSGIVGAGTDTFPVAEVSDGRVTAEALEDNEGLLLDDKLTAGYALDVPDELPGFCGPDL